MEFEFDAEKSRQNENTHGVDFVEAQLILAASRSRRGPVEQPRIATIGRIGSDVWVAIWPPRGAATRLISVRRARPNERKLAEA